jgi:hypothetical protein
MLGFQKPKPDPRLRFSVDDDLSLLREVVVQNPHEEYTRWKIVHRNMCSSL